MNAATVYENVQDDASTEAGAEIHSEHIHRDDVGAKMGMWLFLLTEILLFGGLFILYMAYRLEYNKEFHTAAKELNIALGTINTMILLTSSLTMALSIAAIRRAQKALSIIFLIATIVMAFAFLINKYFEWSAKFHHGIYPGSPKLLDAPKGDYIFFGMYYSMTGLHGVHVLVGIIILSFMLVFMLRGSINSERNIKLENAGLYWHLVDLIWIFLFPLFYLLH
ncbi:MAG: cytochrome c oxidase subunit [Bacteroidota bacterium]|nr:cytochrome c oxidase subunit [Bacteroidota bacterium]